MKTTDQTGVMPSIVILSPISEKAVDRAQSELDQDTTSIYGRMQEIRNEHKELAKRLSLIHKAQRALNALQPNKI